MIFATMIFAAMISAAMITATMTSATMISGVAVGALGPESLRRAYTVLLALVVVERGVELVLSKRNAARVRARGGVELGAGHYPTMVALHSLFLVSCWAESTLLERAIRPALFVAMVIVLALSMSLRYWAIASLGDRWSTRVLVEPGVAPVRGGPYRILDHPNYLAVVLEIAALPLAGGAWITAVVFSALNVTLLRVRIRVEERALAEHCGWIRERGPGARAQESGR